MTRKNKKRLIRIIASALLLIIVSLLPVGGILRALLFLIPYLTVGLEVLIKAVKNTVRGSMLDEQFLMSLATVGAFALKDYKEAVFVMLFYQVGELFQSIAVGKSRKSIAELMSIKPDSATVLRNGEEITLHPSEVNLGEAVIVRAGEKIPLDGTVLEGTTTVDTAALTGESMPRDITVGQRVISGTLNLSGVITFKTERLYENSTVSKILDLVENSSAKKAKTENFITRFARYYTPVVVISALILAFLPPLISGGGYLGWIERALTFLVVSCPCALVVSVPLSFFGGIGGASKKGVLIKGAEYLETLSKVKTLVFDKTGTLTEGKFSVAQICPQGISDSELLRLAAAAESRSTHPIAESILRYYGKAPLTPTEITETAGMGLTAKLNGQTVAVGNERLMKSVGADFEIPKALGTAVHIAKEGCYLGYIIISDNPKPTSEKAIYSLKALGINKTVMLSGDKKEIAEYVGYKLGIDEIFAELLPDGKVSSVEGLLPDSSPLAYVGDGINDAPVLALADVGIAMGGIGSDAAIEAADIVLMDDNPEKIADAIKISRKTMRIAWENIIFSLAVKGIVLILGALGLAGIWLAVFADVGVLVLAILNSMRAMRIEM